MDQRNQKNENIAAHDFWPNIQPQITRICTDEKQKRRVPF
jgi:hypothetical protein